MWKEQKDPKIPSWHVKGRRCFYLESPCGAENTLTQPRYYCFCSLPNCVCLWWCYRFLGGLSTFVCDLEVLYDVSLPAVLFLQVPLAAASKTHKSCFLFVTTWAHARRLEEGSFMGNKRVERVGVCDGSSQKVVQTPTWLTWCVDVTAWSGVWPNIYITELLALKQTHREDFNKPEEYNPTLNGQFVFFVQTLNLAFTSLFDSIWLFVFWGVRRNHPSGSWLWQTDRRRPTKAPAFINLCDSINRIE